MNPTLNASDIANILATQSGPEITRLAETFAKTFEARYPAMFDPTLFLTLAGELWVKREMGE